MDSTELEGTQIALDALELPRLEAVVELAYLAAYADGVVTDAERNVFRGHVSAATKGRLSTEGVETLLSVIEVGLAIEKREERFASIRRRLGEPRLRRAALSLAVRVLNADGVLRTSEMAFVLRAAEALELPATEAHAILSEEAPASIRALR